MKASKAVKTQAHKEKKQLPRTIQTIYYDGNGKVIKINHSSHVNLAVAKAVDYMQLDYYKAKTCEVIDTGAGVPHAVIGWRKMSIVILYKRDPREYE